MQFVRKHFVMVALVAAMLVIASVPAMAQTAPTEPDYAAAFTAASGKLTGILAIVAAPALLVYATFRGPDLVKRLLGKAAK